MADTPDITPLPPKPRRTPARQATESKATARKTGNGPAKSTAKTAAAHTAVKPRKAGTPVASAAPAEPMASDPPSFTDSLNHARAALDTATTAARYKVKGMTDKASSDWKVQGDKMKVQSEQIREKASKLAQDTADSAKTHTGNAMQGLARLIHDTAETVDAKLGPQYGDYARQAANAVAGAAKSLDEKDVDQLLGEARDFVRKSPAVAIGAAAVAGYVLMRLAKGSDSGDE